MKKYFCFHCQKEVRPWGISFKKINWLFCPKCLRRITDHGDGFYRVCDYCGANMAPDACSCSKCGYIFDASALTEQKQFDFMQKRRFYDIVLGTSVICLGFIIAFALFYLSFYILILMFALWVISWLFNKVIMR